MAKYQRVIITEDGKALLERSYLTGEISFTSLELRKSLYQEDKGSEVVQHFEISEAFIQEGHLKLTAVGTNRDLTEDYYLKSICLLAKNELDEPFVFAFCNAEVADCIQAYSDQIGPTELTFDFCFTISGSSNIQVIIEQGAFATIGMVNSLLIKKADCAFVDTQVKELKEMITPKAHIIVCEQGILPDKGELNVLYFVKDPVLDVFAIFYWTGSGYLLGSDTDVKLENYYTRKEVDNSLELRQRKILSGTTEPNNSIGMDGDIFVLLEE